MVSRVFCETADVGYTASLVWYFRRVRREHRASGYSNVYMRIRGGIARSLVLWTLPAVPARDVYRAAFLHLPDWAVLAKPDPRWRGEILAEAVFFSMGAPSIP